MKFEMVTDSAANLPEELIDKYGVHILSLSFFVEDEEFYSYVRGETTDLAKFYQMMREKKHITTSLVNTELAFNQCEQILLTGADLLYIGFSSGLSGSFQSVKVALEDLKEKYPERKIYYVDTLSAALGQGLLVKYAIDMREEGKSIEEVYQWVEDNHMRVCHWLTVDDLFFLNRGGRVSTTAAVFGTALNIKPIIHIDEEGHLIVMEKARGRKKSLDTVLKHFEETVENPEEQWIYISHGDCPEDAEYVAERIREKYKVKGILTRILDPVIGAHAGPGTVALFFLGSKR